MFGLFLLLVTSVGLFSIFRLSEVNSVSTEIQGRWLRAAPLLGEINNLVSDFRAAEANYLLTTATHEHAVPSEDIASLDHAIAKVRHSYELIRRDIGEEQLYARFEAQWNRYRQIADRVIATARTGQREDSIGIYRGESREAFTAASNTLASLVDHNVAGAREAAARESGVYRTSRDLILIAIFIAACAVVAAIVYITRSISDPLLHLALGMHRLANNNIEGDFSGQDRGDEIGAMSRAVLVFRENAIRLFHSQQTLSRQASTLQEALDAERRLTTQQQNFVSMTSHEFRTPLTIIDSHAQRLIRMKDRIAPDDLAERARGIRGAVQRMTRLIDSLLSSLRVIDGDARPRPAPMDIALIVKDVCHMHREVSPQANIEECYSTTHLRTIGDAGLLFQAISNLISNAIKYSPAGSPIRVNANRAESQIMISITDQGVGVPAQDQSHLFERYFRGSNVSDIAGTGVGLYLVDIVVKLHGGSIDLKSAEGPGCTFTMRLPAESPASVSTIIE